MKDEKLKPIEELLQGTDFEDKYEPMVKMANQQVWLIDDLAGGIQEKLASQLRLMSFTILKSEKYPFVTSEFPVLYDVFDKTENETLFKTIFFSISPNIAIIYSRGSNARKNRNRIFDISEMPEKVFKLNNWYLGQNIARSKLLFAQKKSTLVSLVNRG